MDKATIYSAAYLFFAIWIGWCIHALTDRLNLKHHPVWAHIPVTVTLAAAMVSFAFNSMYINLRHDNMPERVGTSFLRAMPENALFLGLWEHSPILKYLQIVEGKRQDIDVVNLVFLGRQTGIQKIQQGIVNGRAVFTTVPHQLQSSLYSFEEHAGCPGLYTVHPKTWTTNTAALQELMKNISSSGEIKETITP
jgi:hypothetical protein